MRYSVPHPIPYQGSKRRLASTILGFVAANRFRTLYEPFAGSAAVTLACASLAKCDRFVISDKLEPLIGIWQQVLNSPEALADEYADIWNNQFSDPERYFYKVRTEYKADKHPAKLLFLIARCVKNSVRFSRAGEFNQSPDKRRRGTQPDTMRAEIIAAHELLAGRSTAFCADYKQVFEMMETDDLVYLDPPYQGTSEGRDTRYISGVSRTELLLALEKLNRRGIQFLLSYDGACGHKTYGDPLPQTIARRFTIRVGRSSQATLNGEDHITTESLYVSHDLAVHLSHIDSFDLEPASQQCALPLVSAIAP